jgi:hypothetical protein
MTETAVPEAADMDAFQKRTAREQMDNDRESGRAGERCNWLVPISLNASRQ